MGIWSLFKEQLQTFHISFAKCLTAAAIVIARLAAGINDSKIIIDSVIVGETLVHLNMEVKRYCDARTLETRFARKSSVPFPSLRGHKVVMW